MNKVLLDTHTFYWLMIGEVLSEHTCNLLKQYAQSSGLCVSAISLWEIAMLAQRKRITLHMPTQKWLEMALTFPYLELCPISPQVAAESCALPDSFHGDPADRIIVATARVLPATLFTRDERILSFSREGFISATLV